MLYGLALILICQLVGDTLVKLLGLPLPGPLVGMLLLFGLCVVRGSVPESVKECGGALLRHMMLLFIPAVAGVMLHFERVGSEWLPFIVAGIGGAAVTLAVTALTLRLMLRLTAARDE